MACPLTWVRTQEVALEHLAAGEVLEVTLLAGEPLRNVPRTAEEEGHHLTVAEPRPELGDGAWRILLVKGEERGRRGRGLASVSEGRRGSDRSRGRRAMPCASPDPPLAFAASDPGGSACAERAMRTWWALGAPPGRRAAVPRPGWHRKPLGQTTRTTSRKLRRRRDLALRSRSGGPGQTLRRRGRADHLQRRNPYAPVRDQRRADGDDARLQRVDGPLP